MGSEMSWLFLSALSFSLFGLMVFLFSRFLGHMKKEQNFEIESLKDTLIDRDNPVGLRGDELEKLKEQQAEAQRHLREVISKIPVIQKDGRFQIDEAELRLRREASRSNDAPGAASADND